MKKKKPSSEAAIVTTRKRIGFVSISFLLFLSLLIANLFRLQYFNYSHYKNKVYDQVTTSSAQKSKRGNIYDSSMTLLAGTKTSWRIFISTKDIKKAEKASAVPYTELISNGLSDILNVDKINLESRIKNTSVLDVTVKKSATEEEYLAVLEFIENNKLENLVFTEASYTRYYPGGTALAHVLGFTGSDSQGLYGLEYYYNNILAGEDGYFLYAKDANGNALDTEYSTYVPGVDGCSLVTTVDSYLQAELESQLSQLVKNHGVENRATGVVMDTKTGAILAMATSSPFNPNSPYELDELSKKKLEAKGFDSQSSEYKAYKKELMEIMWSNKAISETYEPGSTFKIITVATALELGRAKMSDRFSCVGFYEVGGWHIKCHKITGHGSGFTLAYGLQMSCNPTMMRLAERIGVSDFYASVENFGYFEKTGIDLPSEALSIFHKEENMGKTELATASFGQRFKVSIINHLRAVAAVANGGYLVTPYVVDKILDSDGNVISAHIPEKERILSGEVASEVSKVLEEGVSGEGGAKNARVSGYKIAAKTGTSQKFDILDENGNSYLRIASTVAYAPSDECGIAIIIVADEPTSTIKYGSYVAAPYISAFLEKALPYLGYTSTESEFYRDVGNYIGLKRDEISGVMKDYGFEYEIVGSGDFVIAQTPSAGEILNYQNSKIILYTERQTSQISVPSLVGLDIASAIEVAVNAGLNIKISGSIDSGQVVSQSLPYGALVDRGSVIILEALVCDDTE